jgi:thiamine biosynthesis protein ThiI
MDKQEIIDQARKIGTFEISTIPDQDCCQLFVPRHPATKARLSDVEQAESHLDLPVLVDLGTEGAEVVEFKFPDTSLLKRQIPYSSTRTE